VKVRIADLPVDPVPRLGSSRLGNPRANDRAKTRPEDAAQRGLVRLRTGEPVEREIYGGEVHSYSDCNRGERRLPARSAAGREVRRQETL
jgi:hypothetical protein